MSEISASQPDCIDLDYRFAKTVWPDPEEAAEILEQDQCEAFVGGERCYYRISRTDETPCRFVSAQAKALGGLLTDVAFEHIIKPLEDDGSDTP